MLFDFLTRAFIAGIITAIIAPFIGTFLVVRRYSHMADTLAHVSLLGVALGVALNIHPFFTSVVVAGAASVGLEYVRRSKQLGADMTLSLFLYASLAVALLLLNIFPSPTADISSLLFGAITTVSMTDIWIMVGLSSGVVALLLIFYKELVVVSFDEDMARADGLPVTFLNLLIMIIAALVVAITMRIVGLLLIGALMTIPVYSAFQFKRSFRVTVIMSIAIAIISVVCGLLGSLQFDIPSGASVVLVATGIFLLSLVIRRRRLVK